MSCRHQSEKFILLTKQFAQKAVNQASIKTTDLKAIQIPLPPLSIQQEIVNKIEGWQKHSLELKKQIEDNEQKVKDEINKLWQSDKKECAIEDEKLSMVAEG